MRRFTPFHWSRKLTVALLVVSAILCVIGIKSVHNSHAATPFLSLEPELSSLKNATVVTDSTASGGKAVSFGITPDSGDLPFVLPSQTVMKASPKKVFAHYFTPYPIQIDNVDASADYYTRNYLNPTGGTEPQHAASGGLLRDRPLPQPVGGTNWQLDDMKTEVRRATNAGLDGFTVDILGTSGQNWDRFKLLLQAAPQVDPNFKLIMMPDQGDGAVTQGVDSLAAAVASVASNPVLYHLPDGRLVISPYRAEANVTLPDKSVVSGIAYWTQFINTMQTKYGIKIALVPCFLNYQTSADAFAPISYGFSNWGFRYPNANTNLTANIADAHSRGKIWMQPVSVQDSRPYSGAYWESNNTENMRLTWAGADSGADWVQLPTWNDYSENAQIAPSTHTGWSLLDLTSYYLTRFKLAADPPIIKDVLYVSHRIQPYAAVPAGGQTLLQTIRDSTPARDKVEVLAFLKSAGTISVSIGGQVTEEAAPSGASVHTFDLKTGSISASLKRDGKTVTSVTSPFPVVARPTVQDMEYHFVSSARYGGIGSWNDR